MPKQTLTGPRNTLKIIVLAVASLAIALSSLIGSIGTYQQTQRQEELVDQLNADFATHTWNERLAPKFWIEVGPAQDVDENLKDGQIVMEGQDELGRTGAVRAKVTNEMYEAAKNKERKDMSDIKPSGWTKNLEVTYEFPENVTYHGWFWNRSHLLAHSLGGDEVKDNLVTGTRAQNVGDNRGDGGMAHCEETARNWLEDHKNGTLYYAATPVYDGDDLVCKSVYVDMKSSDGTIDSRTEVYNAAPGFEIDYATGKYQESK